MIKCDKGRIEIKGTPMVLVGELGTAIQTVYRAMLNTGDLDKKIDEKLDKLANAILKELFEGGSNDGQ